MGQLDELVEESFQHFLASAGDAGFAACESGFFEIGESGFTTFDLGADTAVPGLVALLNEAIETAIRADGSGGFEAACEGVHADDMGVNEIDGFP